MNRENTDPGDRFIWKAGDVEPVEADRNSTHEHPECGPRIRYAGDAEAGLKETLAEKSEPVRCTCEIEDDGDPENGPHMSVSVDPGCPKHGFQIIRLTESEPVSRAIRVSGKTWRRLQAVATPFRGSELGTPDKVIAFLLDSYEAGNEPPA